MLSNCGNIRITIDDKIKIFKAKGSNFLIDKNNYDICVIELNLIQICKISKIFLITFQSEISEIQNI